MYSRQGSYKHVADNESELLEKGLKYCPRIYNNKELESIVVNTKIALSSVESIILEDKLEFVKVFSNIDKCHSNKSDIETIKTIKKKITNKDHIVCKANKGNTVTVLNKSDYIEKVNPLVFNEDIISLKVDPTENFLKQIITSLKTCNSLIPPEAIYKHKTMNPTAPVLYGLTKLHKQDTPMRPVVSYVYAPSFKLCREVNKIFLNLTKFKSK